MGYWKEQSILRAEGRVRGRSVYGSRYRPGPVGSTIQVDISVLGDRDLQVQFDRLEGMGRRTSIISQSAKKAMMPVLRTMIERAPVDTYNLVAALMTHKQSIRAMRGRRARGYVGARIIMPPRALLDIPANAKGYYPAAQEFGFRTRGGGRYQGKSFVRSSLYDNRSIVFSIMRTEMWKRIKRFMKRKGMTIPEGVGNEWG